MADGSAPFNTYSVLHQIAVGELQACDFRSATLMARSLDRGRVRMLNRVSEPRGTYINFPAFQLPYYNGG